MKRPIIIIVSGLACALLLFIFTDPRTIPASLLIVPFLCVFVVLQVCIFYLLIWREVPRKRAGRISILWAGVPALLLVMQSIGQLTGRDVLTVSAISLLAYFYISRMAVPKK